MSRSGTQAKSPATATQGQGGRAGAKTPPPIPVLHKLWVHCNRCFDLYISKTSKMFLLACHHVACEKCVRVTAHVGLEAGNAPIYQCPICRKEVRGREVGNDMPPQLKTLFHPEPWALTNNFIEVFQQSNYRHHTRHKERADKVSAKVARDVELSKSICKKRFLDQRNLDMERRKRLQRLRQLKVGVARKKMEMEKAREQKKAEKVIADTSSGYSSQGARSPTKGFDQQAPKPMTPALKKRKITGFAIPANFAFDL
ncbi:hypothetical protein KR018_002223 [Drosophila ironensis]|nr:hypothetical protein KR018_002223 [Drosophila ironensis]